MNILERAGKTEVVAAVKESAFKLDDPFAACIRDVLVQEIYYLEKDQIT